MDNFDLLMCTLGMVLGTALPRALPLTILADRAMPSGFYRWLGFVPAAILAALVAPDILLADGRLHLSFDNTFLLAGAHCLFIAWKTRSLFITLAAGMAFVAVARWLFA